MKNIFDRAAAAFCLVALLPLLALITAANVILNPGNPFFTQLRYGMGGGLFPIFKFRTMRAGAERESAHYATAHQDERVTRFGRILRITSLDELPQLANVLLGQMSLIGPRPDVPGQRGLYTDAEFQIRHSVRPGITGLSQVRAIGKTGDRVLKQYDIFYAQKLSFGLDLKIMIWTAAALVQRFRWWQAAARGNSTARESSAAKPLLNRHRGLLLQGAFLSSGLLIGRLSGFLREWMIAHRFSTSADADSFVLALAFPDLINNFISSGILTAVIYPLLTSHRAHVRDLIRAFNIQVSRLAALGYFILGILALVEYGSNRLTLVLLLITLISAFPNALAATAAAVVQFYGKMKAQALSTLVFNFTIIIALAFTAHLPLLAFAILLAALARWQLLAFEMRCAISEEPHQSSASEITLQFRTVSAAIFVATAAQVVAIVSPFLDRFIASLNASGGAAALSYAEKLYMLPGTLVLTVIPYVASPEVFRLAALSREKLRAYAREILIISTALGGVLSLAVYALAGPYTRLVFRPAGLSPESINSVAEILQAYSPTLLFLGPSGILVSVFLSIGARQTIVHFSLLCLALKLALAWACAAKNLPPSAIAGTTSFVTAFFTAGLFGLFLKMDSSTDRANVI